MAMYIVYFANDKLTIEEMMPGDTRKFADRILELKEACPELAVFCGTIGLFNKAGTAVQIGNDVIRLTDEENEFRNWICSGGESNVAR